MKDTKQVIVMRTDLNMRKGKMIAQGAHASLAFLTKDASKKIWTTTGLGRILYAPVTNEAKVWMEESFKKICVRVDSEEQLLEIVASAKAAKLPVELIQDKGDTEFHGIPTFTCCAVGPAWSEDIDKVTGDLKLL